MAIGVILDFPGGTAEQYDRVLDEMRLGGRAAEGGLFHAAGPFDGGWRVVDVWDSAERFQAFAESEIRPKSEAAGLPEPQLQIFEVADSFDQRDGGDGGVTYLQIVRLDGIDRETFTDADGEIRRDGNPAECKFHVNGQTESGQIVVDAWTSKEARDEFLGSRIVPAMQARGLTPPVIDDLAIHNTLIPA